MFQLTLDRDDIYDVRFKHGYVYTGRADGSTTHDHVTVCEIFVGGPEDRREQFKFLCQGSAVCSPRDVFTKDTGRKVALTRALSGVNKKARAIFFDKYHLVSGHAERMEKDSKGYAVRQELLAEYLGRNKTPAGIVELFQALKPDTVIPQFDRYAKEEVVK